MLAPVADEVELIRKAARLIFCAPACRIAQAGVAPAHSDHIGVTVCHTQMRYQKCEKEYGN